MMDMKSDAAAFSDKMIDPALFEQLKTKIEQDSRARDDINDACEALEKAVNFTQGVITRVHNTPRSQYPAFLTQIGEAIAEQVKAVQQLDEVASKHPYYKHNQKWTRYMQDAILTVLTCAWLGGLGSDSRPGELGRILDLEEVGTVFKVPVNLKDRDAFHITIEEYLAALTSLTDDLSRLAVNSVTLGDYDLAVRISGTVRDLHSGFQLLNLKNDFLRKRVDGVKYAVKSVEGVVYDLSLRGLIAKEGSSA